MAADNSERWVPFWIGGDDRTENWSEEAANEVARELSAPPITAPTNDKYRKALELFDNKRYRAARRLLWAYRWNWSNADPHEVISELCAPPITAPTNNKDLVVRSLVRVARHDDVRRLLWAYDSKTLVETVQAAFRVRLRKVWGDDENLDNCCDATRCRLYVDLFFAGEMFGELMEKLKDKFDNVKAAEARGERKKPRRVVVSVLAEITNAIRGSTFPPYGVVSYLLAFFCLKPSQYIAFMAKEEKEEMKERMKEMKEQNEEEIDERMIYVEVRKQIEAEVREQIEEQPTEQMMEDVDKERMINDVVEERFETEFEERFEAEMRRPEEEEEEEGAPEVDRPALNKARAVVDQLRDACIRAEEDYPNVSKFMAARWLGFLFTTGRETDHNRASTRIAELNRRIRDLPFGLKATVQKAIAGEELESDSLNILRVRDDLLYYCIQFYRFLRRLPGRLRGVARMLMSGKLDAVLNPEEPQNSKLEKQRKLIERQLSMPVVEIRKQTEEIRQLALGWREEEVGVDNAS